MLCQLSSLAAVSQDLLPSLPRKDVIFTKTAQIVQSFLITKSSIPSAHLPQLLNGSIKINMFYVWQLYEVYLCALLTQNLRMRKQIILSNTLDWTDRSIWLQTLPNLVPTTTWNMVSNRRKTTPPYNLPYISRLPTSVLDEMQKGWTSTFNWFQLHE